MGEWLREKYVPMVVFLMTLGTVALGFVVMLLIVVLLTA